MRRNPFLCLFLFIALAPFAFAQTETVLFQFTMDSGISPLGGITPDSSGNLYGTASFDGPAGYGVVYKFDRHGKYTILHAFRGGADGGYPDSGVIVDVAGNIYGTAGEGGASNHGVIFKIDSSGKFTILHSFTGGAGGKVPAGTLLLAPTGMLYGVTNQGGIFTGYGLVYELDPNDPVGHFKVIHSFTGADGAYPDNGVLQDAAGNLYGATRDNQTTHAGLVYKIDPEGNETVLFTFSGGLDGSAPYGRPILDLAGNLYGTTDGGGTFGKGVVYRLDPSGHETILHNFAGAPDDGANGQWSLSFDALGNIYGTTALGGTANFGTVFKIDRNTLEESLVYSFTGPDGESPTGSLVVGSGIIWGSTEEGGTGGSSGVIFKITQ